MEKKTPSESGLVLWTGNSGISLPAKAEKPSDVIVHAVALTTRQQETIINAIENGAYDMAAEYVWKRSMSRLQSILGSLGMKFIGEMLGRPDIDEFSSVEASLTDYSTISLCEQLGIINGTGAMRLRHAMETINHFVLNQSENIEDEVEPQEEFAPIDANQTLLTCVKYVLGYQNITVATDFSRFRDRLLSEKLSSEDGQVQQIINSPIFYLSTVTTVLLTAIKEDKGAKLENALGNLNSLIQHIWQRLPERDKWSIGGAYRDTIASGNIIASAGLKAALMKVKGFDFVPETIRSNTFIKAAKQLIEAHFSYDNFYNEGPLVANLAKLGSGVPSPALADCIQAYLVVYIGNRYGVSNSGQPIADGQLKLITPDRWEFYFNRIFKDDEIILEKLTETRPTNRFITLLNELDFNMSTVSNKDVLALLKASKSRNITKVNSAATAILSRRRKTSPAF